MLTRHVRHLYVSSSSGISSLHGHIPVFKQVLCHNDSIVVILDTIRESMSNDARRFDLTMCVVKPQVRSDRSPYFVVVIYLSGKFVEICHRDEYYVRSCLSKHRFIGALRVNLKKRGDVCCFATLRFFLLSIDEHMS